MRVRMVRLEEVCEINPRAPKDIRDDAVVSFIPMSAVSEDGHVSFEQARTYGEVKKGYTYFERGDVLVAKITPCFENGKAASTETIQNKLGFGSTEFHVLRPYKDLDPKYVFYLIWSERFRKIGEKGMTGSAGQKRVPADLLRRFEIPLPPLHEQKRIAEILDKADALRAKRRQAIALLDSLTQSIFLEMFGDPVNNPKGWQMATLGDVIHQASDGPHVSPQYSDEGVPFLSTRHVARGRIIWQDLKHISEEDAKIHWRKCKPERGDVLYTKGGTTGIAAHVDFDEPFAIWVHVALLKTKHDVVSPKWLECMLNGNYCYQQSQTYTHGIANRDLGLKRMVKIKIFVPPLERQVEFVERTNSLAHVTHQAELQSTKADSLFASLQHRAFTGQL